MIRATDLYVLRAGSALRPPSWRWELARLLNNRRSTGDRSPVDSKDPDVVSAAHAMDLLEGTNKSEEERLAGLDAVPPWESDAYVFWSRSVVAAVTDPPAGDPENYPVAGPLTADALARAQLEGLVLARQSPERIAKTCGLSADAVRQYEKWWFDVRDRLDRPGWVSTSVIGSLQQGPPSLLLPALVRAYGYYTRNARVVKAVTGLFDGPHARATAKDPAKFFASDAVSAGGLKAALAVRMVPLTRKTYARVMELHQAAMDVAVKSGQGAGSEDMNNYKDLAIGLFNRATNRYQVEPVEVVPQIGPPRIVPEENAG